MNLKKIDTKVLEEALKDDEWIVVDARDSSTFMGWRLGGEKKRGHIPGAVDFSADWLRFPCADTVMAKQRREARLEQKIVSKKIDKDKKIILYDTTGEDVPIVAAFFNNRGCEELYYYNFGDWEKDTIWSPHYEYIVPAEWVKAVIDGENPEFYDGGPYKIFDVSETDEPSQEFIDAHIPGAVHISCNEFQKSPEWRTVTDEELEVFARNNGITVDTTVILYGTGYPAASHILATVLQYMGVKHVHCLNGSSVTWQMKGYQTESGYSPKIPVESFGASIPLRGRDIVKLPEAKRITEGKSEDQLVDMRFWRQYIGATSGYPYVEKAGRLPNTIWCCDKYWYMNPDQTVGNSEEIIEHWKSCGIDLEKRIVFFCGAGGW